MKSQWVYVPIVGTFGDFWGGRPFFMLSEEDVISDKEGVSG